MYQMSSKIHPTDGNYITVKFGKRTMEILIDSGSIVSLISKKVVHDLKLTVTPPPTNNQQLHLFSANGTKMMIEGTAYRYSIVFNRAGNNANG